MKKTANVVIIGGGIVGCTIAAELAAYMDDVVLVERNDVENYASSSNFGMVWLQTRFPGYDTTMSRRSQEVYEKYISDPNGFDIDIEYEKKGGLTIAYSEFQLEIMKKQCMEKQKVGTPMCMIDRADTLALEPSLSPEVKGAIFCGDDARVNPMMATMAYANLARKRGAIIYERTQVTDVKIEGGRVESVETDKGEILTPIVINAAGVWARDVAAMVGMDLPVFSQRLQALVTEPMPHILNNRIIQVARDIEEGMDPEKATGFMFEYEGEQKEENLPRLPVEETIFTYIQQTLSDTVAIGTTNEFVGYDVRTTPAGLSAMMKGAIRACPALEYANIIRTWASLVPFTFDGMPFVGPIDEVEGFILATGHGHAMCHAPALALDIKELIVDGHENDLLREKNIKRIR